MACRLRDIAVDEIETIRPFTLAPWDERAQTVTDDTADGQCAWWSVRVAVNTSARNEVVGVGGAMQLPNSVQGRSKPGPSPLRLALERNRILTLES